MAINNYEQKGYIGIQTDAGVGYGYENGKKYYSYGAWPLGTTQEEADNWDIDRSVYTSWVGVKLYDDGTISEFPIYFGD